jgi:predicted metal-dependent hydrolase
MSELLEVGGLSFEVRRSARRKTVALTVDRTAELLVHAPADVSQDVLAHWVEGKLLWVHRKLAVKRALESRVRSPEFVTGESFTYLGRRYRLRIVASQDDSLHFGADGFSLRSDSREHATRLFRRWYSERGQEWVQRRVAALAPRIAAMPAAVSVRDLGFRWGSCTAKGVLNLNWKLLQLPVRLADYVILHELAHLVEPHHGPAFWSLLDRALPDWKVRQDALRQKATELYWCHSAMVG